MNELHTLARKCRQIKLGYKCERIRIRGFFGSITLQPPLHSASRCVESLGRNDNDNILLKKCGIGEMDKRFARLIVTRELLLVASKRETDGVAWRADRGDRLVHLDGDGELEPVR